VSGGRAVYPGWGCTSTSTVQECAKCSMTSCISCVHCSIVSSGVEGRISRAGDGAGETGQAGGGGGWDERADGVAAVMTVLDTLHVHNLVSCGHRGQPAPMVSPVPYAQAQVYPGY